MTYGGKAPAPDADMVDEPDWPAYFEPVGVGVQVEYVLPDGQLRPAIIVRKWDGGLGDMVNLTVFLDGRNDSAAAASLPGYSAPDLLLWATSVHYAPPEDQKPGTWHYMDEGKEYEDEPQDGAVILVDVAEGM